MRIRFEETLGSVGITREVELELDAIPAEFRGLVDSLLSAKSTLEPSMRDVSTVFVSNGDQSNRLCSWDLPADAEGLIAFLRNTSKPRR